ncbi:GntR family transcriptional regulator [Haloimpatiens lingqiaonensis]|uniref:GntR family transcriptional regulator n=1 Tax=Haloimpatiens lingqiaonensis TaxID=1380675 RepID=UPI0010FD2CAE|nr:GntR family transcriptional regulator [Haloimpatiens lingqiaonensis]
MIEKFDEKLPIYMQVANIIKKQIISSELKRGDKLPSVRELSSILKVNPNTVQRAYGELDKEGLTFTQRGTGSFVTEDENKINSLRKEMANEVIEFFFKEMKELGFKLEDIKCIVSEKIQGEEK